jgi:hypothetical protein
MGQVCFVEEFLQENNNNPVNITTINTSFFILVLSFYLLRVLFFSNFHRLLQH